MTATPTSPLTSKSSAGSEIRTMELNDYLEMVVSVNRARDKKLGTGELRTRKENLEAAANLLEITMGEILPQIREYSATENSIHESEIYSLMSDLLYGITTLADLLPMNLEAIAHYSFDYFRQQEIAKKLGYDSSDSLVSK